jgi:S1-C subfamily serine protease
MTRSRRSVWAVAGIAGLLLLATTACQVSGFSLLKPTGTPAPAPAVVATVPAVQLPPATVASAAVQAPPATMTPTIVVVTATPDPAGLVGMVEAQDRVVNAVYERVNRSVVHVTSRVVREDFFFGAYPEEGAGSGWVYDADGHIVTNYHVVENADEIEVSFAGDQVVAAKVVAVDPQSDLAVIKVDLPAGIQPLELGSSDNLMVGQTTIAIGSPFGEFDRTLTVGVISALERTVQLENDRVIRRVIQTDAAINPGNSGGPLLDVHGRLIGINTAIVSTSGSSAGVGFAIPVRTVQKVVPALIKDGSFPHPWLGTLGYSITPALARSVDLPVQRGILIARLYQDSPADKAGLRGASQRVRVGNSTVLVGGDIITAVDGRETKDQESLDAYLDEQTSVGDTVKLTILRDGKEQEVSVTLGSAPAQGGF